jgi:uncharacterized DUF497 family protein
LLFVATTGMIYTMVNWNKFIPKGFEYDFERDELHAHQMNIEEAVQCFHNPFTVLRNKQFNDRFKLIGKTDAGRKLCVIFQLKKHQVVRIITGWEV